MRAHMQVKLTAGFVLNAARRPYGTQERMGDDRIDHSERQGEGQAEFLLPLSRTAIGTLGRPPGDWMEGTGPIFTTDGERPLAARSQFKTAFDAVCPLEHLTIHDLRRTARPLEPGRGTGRPRRERAIGHVIGGIRGIAYPEPAGGRGGGAVRVASGG
jgi:hypothetical protein